MDKKVYEFDAVIEPVPNKGGAYVRFPYDVREEFGKGKGRVKADVTFDGELREHTSPARSRVAPSKKRDRDKEKERFTLSVILNVMLALAIVAMFVISFVSDQPNILNYERAITDKYASWEQELNQREQTIRDKERELKLNE